MPLRAFLQHVTQALKTKTGCTPSQAWQTCRTLYGIVIALAKEHPSQLVGLAEQFDYLPRGRDRWWYVAAMRGLVAEAQQGLRDAPRQQQGQAAQGREVVVDYTQTQPMSDLVEAALGSMLGVG